MSSRRPKRCWRRRPPSGGATTKRRRPDCRPGLEALNDADEGKFSHKPWEQTAGKDERFFWIQRSPLSLAHVAHHPNDPVLAGDTAPDGSARWSRTDAETATAILAALIRQRIGHDMWRRGMTVYT